MNNESSAHKKNDATPCASCPKSLGCPFLRFSVNVRIAYCRLYREIAQQIAMEAKQRNTMQGWEPMTSMPLPYYPN